MVDVASLRVVVQADTKAAEAGLSSMNDKVKTSQGFFKTALSNALSFAGAQIGITSVADAFGLVKNTVADLVSAGMDANNINAQLAAGLKSTGDASGMTMQSLNALADSITGQTGITDDAVKSSESMLLTFRSIGKDVFPQATQAVADLATKMANGAVPSSQQMEQASIQLGKALGNPLTGFTALQRVGVTFSEQQKEQIKQFMKVGDVAGAQRVILGEMKNEFGGAAAAAGHANGGLAILTAQFDTMREKVGQAVIPVLDQLMQAIEPVVQAFANWLPGAISAVVGGLTGILSGAIRHAHDLFTTFRPVLIGIAVALLAAVVPALLTFAGSAIAATAAALPLIAGAIIAAAPFIALAAAVAGIAAAFQYAYTHFAPFHNAVNQVIAVVRRLVSGALAEVIAIFHQLVPVLQLVAAWIGTHVRAAVAALTPHVQGLASGLSSRLGPAIHGVSGFLQTAGAIIMTVAGVVGTVLMPILKLLWQGIQLDLAVVSALWGAVWPAMLQVLTGVWNLIKGEIEIAWAVVSGIIKIGLDLLGGKWGKAWNDLKDMLSGVWNGIQTMLSGALQVITGLITGAFNALVDTVKTIGQHIIQGLIDGIKGMAGAAGNALLDVGKNMLGGIKSIFGIHSPSTVFAEIGKNLGAGLVQGFQGIDIAGAVAQHLSTVHAAVMGSVGLNVTGGGSSSSLGSQGGGSIIPNIPVAAATVGNGGLSSLSGSGRELVLDVHLHNHLDGRELTESVVKHMPRTVRLATGLKI